MRDPGRALTINRVLTVKLAPDEAQWRRLRDLAWQAMQYRNQFVRARWAEMAGLCVRPDGADAHDVSKHVRRHAKGELSAAVYGALEPEVRAVLTRDGKRILAGAPLPQWRQADSLSVRGPGNAGKEKAGGYARIVESAGRFYADLPLQASGCEGGCHIVVPLAGGTEIDDYQAPLLQAMASGSIAIGKMTVCFSVKRGRCLLRIAYTTQRHLPPMGERVATLGPVTKDGRLVLRTEAHTMDYTARLANVKAKGDQWDLTDQDEINARDLARAAQILADTADELEASHTVGGEWPADMDLPTARAKADCNEYRALAARLRKEVLG